MSTEAIPFLGNAGDSGWTLTVNNTGNNELQIKVIAESLNASPAEFSLKNGEGNTVSWNATEIMRSSAGHSRSFHWKVLFVWKYQVKGKNHH
jgi:hypothetical protein